MVVVIAWATFCISMVLPALGGDTIRPRWPLPRRHQVEDAAGDVLGRAVAALELEALAREQRGEVLEQDLVLRRLRRLAVDGVDLVSAK
jgi:hypothetical protein